MKQKLHLHTDEVLALFNREWEMLPEITKHVKECEACQNLIESYFEIGTTVAFNSDTVYSNTEKANEIAKKQQQM